MRFRRRPGPDPAVVRQAGDALAAAEHELAAADAAHRSAYAAEVARWAEVPRSARPPEDIRTALARQASSVAYERLVVARAAVERARRAYYAAVREGARQLVRLLRAEDVAPMLQVSPDTVREWGALA